LRWIHSDKSPSIPLFQRGKSDLAHSQPEDRQILPTRGSGGRLTDLFPLFQSGEVELEPPCPSLPSSIRLSPGHGTRQWSPWITEVFISVMKVNINCNAAQGQGPSCASTERAMITAHFRTSSAL
jgi:hypothetical protein